VTSTNEFRVSFTGVSGLSYSILASWDLNRWFVLGTAVETAPALFEFLDTTPTSGARFYRIRSP
jgi:hypothetical protein